MFILFILTLLCLAIIWLATTAIFVAAACFCSLTVLVLEMRRREYSNQHRHAAKLWLRCLKRVVSSSPLSHTVILMSATLATLRVAACYALHSLAARPQAEFATFVVFPEQFLFVDNAGKFVMSTNFANFLIAESVIAALFIGFGVFIARRAATIAAHRFPLLENKLRILIVRWLAT